jgi:hypothetical protein
MCTSIAPVSSVAGGDDTTMWTQPPGLGTINLLKGLSKRLFELRSFSLWLIRNRFLVKI